HLRLPPGAAPGAPGHHPAARHARLGLAGGCRAAARLPPLRAPLFRVPVVALSAERLGDGGAPAASPAGPPQPTPRRACLTPVVVARGPVHRLLLRPPRPRGGERAPPRVRRPRRPHGRMGLAPLGE